MLKTFKPLENGSLKRSDASHQEKSCFTNVNHTGLENFSLRAYCGEIARSVNCLLYNQSDLRWIPSSHNKKNKPNRYSSKYL